VKRHCNVHQSNLQRMVETTTFIVKDNDQAGQT